EDAPAEVVAEAAQVRDLGGKTVDDGDRRVLVEVVHDDELVGCPDAAGQGAQDGLDVLALVVDRQDDRELGSGAVRAGPAHHAGAHRRPAATSSRIHGMTSSSIVSSEVVAS